MTINQITKLPEILVITSYPPRECGIATYSQDLIKAIKFKFNESFNISICALESEFEKYSYDEIVKYKLDTSNSNDFTKLSYQINRDVKLNMILIQHEFGFFAHKKVEFITLLECITKPIIIVFHTVLPKPNEVLREHIQQINSNVSSIIVMTNTSKQILIDDYGIQDERITVIPHGTHLVKHLNKEELKLKYNVKGKRVLLTFGLLSSGKNIETTIKALPSIIKENKDVLFLILGKTHPNVVKHEGENYGDSLEQLSKELGIEKHVMFVNSFVPLNVLLEYLQLTDIYLFTSKDPNQAVSGTFSYAISCGCPIISTPIPHALEVLKNNAGIIIDFENPTQLAYSVNKLLRNELLRNTISNNGLHTIASTSWENSAISHAMLLKEKSNSYIQLEYSIPEINLHHIEKLTTNFGMIQFSKLNKPDIETGYTLDDNARALIAMCQHFELTNNVHDLELIETYFNFIKFCLQCDGNFLNYVDIDNEFTAQNEDCNLADANGRAIWAIGYLLSHSEILPIKIVSEAKLIFEKAIVNVDKIFSTRAMAFVIKGLYYRSKSEEIKSNSQLICELSDRLVQMFHHESDENWLWFESYLTYANSSIPEALICAWKATGNDEYLIVAKKSFDFLLTKIFHHDTIKVISNKGWLHNGIAPVTLLPGGEQPIDVAYTINALSKFYFVFNEESYLKKLKTSFDWFLGNNHLHQIIYNPCTGGCYDGLEEFDVNLNQGAESTVSYLMARLTLEKTFNKLTNKSNPKIVKKSNRRMYSIG